jgi:hypothetical protein
MPETFRTRDCVVLYKGDAYPTEVDEELATQGWVGGQGVQWTTTAGDRFVVTRSDGLYAGFLLKGSNEVGDKFTAITQNQSYYRVATLCAGGWLIMTTAFERYTWASRTGGGPLVEIVYQPSDRLVFSNRGLWTVEDEFTLSGDPRAPNDYYIGFVVQAPTVDNDYFMTIQTSI